MRESDDDLRARLRRLDPAGDLPVDPVSSPRAASSMERVVQTLDPSPVRRAPRRARLLAGAAVLGAAAAVTAGVLLTDREDPRPADAPTTLTLAMPPSDAFASCVPFEVRYLADMSPAFAGTAIEVGDHRVVLDVDHWYTGGNADRVLLEAPGGAAAAALGYGVDFERGERYLVTAANGTVNGCGYSGPATPEFERSFEEAFAG